MSALNVARSVLSPYPAKGEALTLAVVGVISSRDPEFWELACEMFERYPDG